MQRENNIEKMHTHHHLWQPPVTFLPLLFNLFSPGLFQAKISHFPLIKINYTCMPQIYFLPFKQKKLQEDFKWSWKNNLSMENDLEIPSFCLSLFLLLISQEQKRNWKKEKKIHLKNKRTRGSTSTMQNQVYPCLYAIWTVVHNEQI